MKSINVDSFPSAVLALSLSLVLAACGTGASRTAGATPSGEVASAALAPLETGLTLEHASATRTISDGAASGGQAASLLSNGHSARYVVPTTLAAGRYAVQLRARGDLWGGHPAVALKREGAQLGVATVGSSTYGTFPLGTFALSAGQALDVIFTNDAYGGGYPNDRNVYTDTLTLVPEGVAASPALAPTPAPTVAPTRRVMPLGDSITDGYNIPGGYRPELFQKLTAAGLPTDFVGSLQNGTLADRHHEGHSGWRIDEISARVDGWLTTFQPEVILLMIGTNDVIQGHDLANAPARLGALLDKIAARRPSATVLVASIPPLSDATRNSRARAFNAAVPGLVKTRAAAGRKVRFVDAYPALTPSDLADGVHPNSGGYRKLADLWWNALRAL